MKKRLYRSDKNVLIAGVFGGVSEYFDVDPVFVRLAAVFVGLTTAIVPLALVYVLAVFVIPKRTADGV